jgi:predicted peptidase
MKKKRIIVALFAIILLFLVGCGIYVSDYYHADETALEALASSDTVTVEQSGNIIVFAPQEPTEGLIFYPGGKVEAAAYAPLLHDLAEQNILCVLVKMPLRLAVLDVNAADGIPQQFPDIERWYIGGHSLGGSMAASFASKHTGEFDGLILLAAYSTADLSSAPVWALSIRGSEDGVLNLEKHDKYLSNLPADSAELVIQGGCHAGFGSYGAQSGDGTPTISAQEQMEITAQAISDRINESA